MQAPVPTPRSASIRQLRLTRRHAPGTVRSMNSLGIVLRAAIALVAIAASSLAAYIPFAYMTEYDIPAVGLLVLPLLGLALGSVLFLKLRLESRLTRSIAAVVLGGTRLAGGEGSIVGTMIGALIMAVLANGLNAASVDQTTQKIIVGCVLIVAAYIDSRRGRTRPAQRGEGIPVTSVRGSR